MQNCMPTLPFPGFCINENNAISLALDARTCSKEPTIRRVSMSVHDLPVTARSLAVVVAIALVATALAPLLFVAARVIA